MISKEMFLDTINFIYNQRKKDDILCDAIMKVCSYSSVNSFYDTYENQVVNILEDALRDSNELISYKLYELDSLSVPSREKKIKEFPELESWESLYDYLVKNYKENNNE